MGNCLKSNKVMAQDEPSPSPSPLPPTETDKVDKPAGGSALVRRKTEEARSAGRRKKVVRFKLQEDENSGEGKVIVGRTGDESGAGGGVLRIKKEVRFKLQEDENSGEGEVIVGRSGDGSGAGGGVLRIKVVVSQKELKQILKDRDNNSCTLEEMLAELKTKGRTTISDARTDEDEDEDENGSWRPTLESIPEDLY